MEDIKMIQIINYIYIVGLNSRQNHVRDEVNSHFCIQQRLEGKGATSSRQSSSCGWTSSANIIFCRLYVGQILHCFNAWLACDLAMFTTFLNVHPASVQTSSRFESSKKKFQNLPDLQITNLGHKKRSASDWNLATGAFGRCCLESGVDPTAVTMDKFKDQLCPTDQSTNKSSFNKLDLCWMSLDHWIIVCMISR